MNKYWHEKNWKRWLFMTDEYSLINIRRIDIIRHPKLQISIFLKNNAEGQYSIINLNLGKFNIDNADNTDENVEKVKFKQDVLSKYSVN